jgi:hypothetical protein
MELNGWICCVIIFTTSVPKNSAFMPKHKFRVNLHSRKFQSVQNTHKHHYWSKGLERMHLVENDYHNFGTPK